jgi:dCMP deaminase
MAKRKMIHHAHLEVAQTYARLSKAKRLKVGAIVVKDNRVISIGYNGTPAGWDNNCEDEVRETTNCILDTGGPLYPITSVNLKTKPEVIHAEANAIGKIARSNESGLDAVMYITHSPCFDCAKLIHIAGIKKVYFRTHYRNEDGINFLKKCNIEVEKL